MSKVDVCIVGGGPAGLLLGQLLHHAGISNVILERRPRDHVLGRIRAGVLEDGSQRMLREAGVGTRMDAHGLVHGGVAIASDDALLRIDLQRLTGRSVRVWGQTEVTRDLYDARDAARLETLHEAEDVRPHGFDGRDPFVTFTHKGEARRIDCAFVAGCDGFHGPCRAAAGEAITTFERAYPFGWLGVMADVPPLHDELVYGGSRRGFALASMRSTARSRYYVQCPTSDRVEDWPDARFWEALAERLPPEAAANLVTGPPIEKSIAPLRAFVAEPMRVGRLFLAGDAAHIVPPTGAKGLNLAIGDVHYLSGALRDFFATGDEAGLKAYSDRALARVWRTERFSWWLTNLLHDFPDRTPFERRMREAELETLFASEAMQASLAEGYVGVAY